MGALEVARTAQLEVGFGNTEAVVGLAHDVDASACVVAELIGRDEDAERLVCSPAYAATKLVELAEAEALGVEDDHDRGVGHVDAHLDNGCGYEHLRLAADETLHLEFLLLRLHMPMDLAHAELGESLTERLESVLEILQVDFLALLDKREDAVDLSALTDLPADAFVEGSCVGVEDVCGSDGLSAWWQLVDDAYVEVAVERHGQGARDGRGCHDEDVRKPDHSCGV